MNDAVDVSARLKSTVQPLRRLLALIAVGALVSSLYVFLRSFFGLTLDQMGKLPILLHLGIFALMIPIFIIEYSAVRERTFFWKGFSVGKPAWVPKVISLLGILLLIQFIIFLLLSHGAAPRVVDATYVLDNHGDIVKVLTEPQYRHLKGFELRSFATVWIFAYFISTMYWWFPRLKREALYS